MSVPMLLLHQAALLLMPTVQLQTTFICLEITPLSTYLIYAEASGCTTLIEVSSQSFATDGCGLRM